jgi:hypothetical protein
VPSDNHGGDVADEDEENDDVAVDAVEEKESDSEDSGEMDRDAGAVKSGFEPMPLSGYAPAGVAAAGSASDIEMRRRCGPPCDVG